MTCEQEPSSNTPVTPAAVFSNEPPVRLYVVGFAIAFALAFAFCSQWLTPAAAAVAGFVAGVMALYGVFSIENVGEGCFSLAITCLLVWIAPKIDWVLLTIVPFFLGLSVGKICVGLWKGRRHRG